MARGVRPDKKPQFYALASIAIFVAVLYLAQAVLIPLALAILISFLLAPLVAHLERFRVGRIASVLIVVAIGLGLVGTFAWTMEQRFADIVAKLPEYRDSVRAKFHQVMQSNGVVERVQEEIRTVTDPTLPKSSTTRPAAVAANTQPAGETVRSWLGVPTTPMSLPPPTPESPWPVRVYPQPTSTFELAFEYLGKLANPFLTAGLVVVLVIFMLLNREDLRDRVIYLVGHGRLHLTIEALDDAAMRVSRFLLAQSIINASFGVLVAAGLWIIDRILNGGQDGLPTAALAGLLCGLLRFIPFVGIWIGASLPLALAFAVHTGNTEFFVTLALFVALEVLFSQAIEPNFLGSRTGISPLAILVATVFWAWLWGPIGLLLSTPLTVLLVVMGKYVPQLEYLDVLLGDTPVLDPPMRIYQRLVAGDQKAAMELALTYLKGMPLEEVYDRILIPALAAAQRDWHGENLDESRYVSIREGFQAIVQALGSRQDEPVPPAAARPRLPQGSDVHIMCLPPQHEADEIVGVMLAQLLERRGYRVTCLHAQSLVSEFVGSIEEDKPNAIVVSALPPKAAIHARQLLKRLRPRFPDLKVVVALWADHRYEKKTAINHLDDLRPATTLAQAEDQLDQLVPLILVESASAA